jgi:hypothetical protein
MEFVLYGRMRSILLFGILAAALASGSCKSPTSPDAPEGHTVNKNGVYHRPGLENPTVNCTNCHGADLRGGSAGVSCFKCHGQKW